MGWTFMDRGFGRGPLTTIKAECFDDHNRPVAHKRRGGAIYFAVEATPESLIFAKGLLCPKVCKSVVTYGLVAMVKENRREFGFKIIDEFAGPADSLCPAEILDQLSPFNPASPYAHQCDYAKEWRARCSDWVRRVPRDLKIGDVIRYDEPLTFQDETRAQEFRIEPGRKRGRVYRCTSSGRLYRIFSPLSWPMRLMS